MKHIRFMVDNQTICENPQRLDLWDSPVITDYIEVEGESCKECFALLVAHNQKEFELEGEHLMEHNRITHEHQDPLGPAKGVMWGVLFSSVFWVMFVMILWIIFKR